MGFSEATFLSDMTYHRVGYYNGITDELTLNRDKLRRLGASA